MHDSSILCFIEKVKSWISWRRNMDNNSYIMCCHCNKNMLKSCLKYHCQNCQRLLCMNCVHVLSSPEGVGSCPKETYGRRYSGKVYPSESPSRSSEPPSPSFSGDRFGDLSPHPSRSDEDEGEGEETTSDHFFSIQNYVDSSSVSTRHEYHSFTSIGSISQSDNNEQAILEKPADDLSQSLDFRTNELIWFPPRPCDVSDDVENNVFTYDDEDDEAESSMFYPSSVFLAKEKHLVHDNERGIVEGHFRVLVSHLLKGNCGEDWVDIVTGIAWQAAKFIKPDTSGGGSMDPCDYLKVKCVASGSPNDSKLIKGVVCTKNIKHKRMTSQYKNARLLLLGGALEYQRVPNQLASFETLLQQENDHLKAIVARIEAHHPNVLLVEKSVSSFALEHLLAKEISLVLNVKRSVLERIARCTGASVTPSTDHIFTARLGHCELFHLERVSEEHEPVNKKPLKTLMFFEGCPRRLGCTVVLRGSYREELKKVKQVVQYAVFAAYHLSLQTSFLADEGASLPKTTPKSPVTIPEKTTLDRFNSADLSLGLGLQQSLSELSDSGFDDGSISDEFRYRKALSDACYENLALPSQDESQSDEVAEVATPVEGEGQQSILVSFSRHCMENGTICEHPRLLRVKYYGPSDKPLGRYLRDDLFTQSYQCRTCKESAEAHMICYTHQNANLTINVKNLPSVKLPGEQDGKIWMWHRCLRCEHVEGVPPATRRVVMSNAAWGLSFGKFLELSFSNHATGNRVASCGHSLQRDCLRFYGFGSMVAFFRYSPINILSIRLPPSVLEFSAPGEQSWIRTEAYELFSKVEALYAEFSAVLEDFKIKSLPSTDAFSDGSDFHNHVLELIDMLSTEKAYYKDQVAIDDILEINRLRRSLLIDSHVWDRRLSLLDSLLKKSPSPKALNESEPLTLWKDSDTCPTDTSLDLNREDNTSEYSKSDEENALKTSLERFPSAASILSDQIDSAWSGADQKPSKDNPAFVRLMAPTRVHSFDSAQRLQERIEKGSLYLSNLRSFHASGDYRYMIRDPVMSPRRSFSQSSLHEADQKSNLSSILPEGARLMVPQNGPNDIVITVYDKEPTSIVSYALASKASGLSSWHSFGSLDFDDTPSPSTDSPHLRISFEDKSPNPAKFSVTCYYAKQFDALRKKCCPNEEDFIRSLSRCKRWSAQGGKSNVYFAKSLDDRFIIKQVTKTELDSFEECAPEYFKYLTDALTSGSPTCLAKVVGMYQVTVKNMKGGKEVKMDLMVMENLFFRRNISKVYDLKGSARSRYNADKTGANKVLLDSNLLETLRTNPMFLGSKAKRSLERAVWNDTSFLASVDVMDYSLLVGVDEERKELVIGIIDYMRQYTWDKHLETWVKASGILGGPKNASPTIVSPKQYKKRFRKAMTNYFLTVPDQWLS